MDLLCYDSDDDGDSNNDISKKIVNNIEAIATPSPLVPASLVNRNSSANSNGDNTAALKKKKIKKLDLSIFPPAIQAALIRGDAINDSDSDDDRTNVSNTTNTSSTTIRNRNGTSSSADINSKNLLLSMLPKPQNDVCSAQVVGVSNAISTSSSWNNGNSTTVNKKSNFVFDTHGIKTSVGKVVDIHSSSSSSSSSSRNDHIDDITAPTGLATSLFSFADDYKATPKVIAAVPFMKISPAPYVPLHDAYQLQGLGEGNDKMYHETVTTSEVSSSNSSSRKRQRELEQNLLMGNMDVISNMNVHQVSGVDKNNWDSSIYMEKQQMYKDVMGQYNIGEGGAQPINKAASRKNTLTALVHKAAKFEVGLLDKQANKQKNKAETIKKYGW